MNAAHRLGLAAGLLILALPASQGAMAQPVGYVFHAPEGPSVLRTDGVGRVVVPPSRPDLAAPAVPVPQVMNGGGFGLSGFDYYNDELTEGRLGARKQSRTYVIAPAYLGPVLR
ncbi:hypothetical protein [Methylobacterium trifolii]|uniref:Uncharacterized protein n=1 Tax=Methylobacterium trifolii TaxID=1003092 RepID=A0ABQ4U212_9HYPH|nr:hypothetical protein [Methylobacterium trifolii]GJE61209.1 hypothetical protein MPOCJGCO_3330 [Methylobacterium trifolii]